MIDLAPIVLFTYKRVDTLIKTVEALSNNSLASESELYIFSDAAKNENEIENVLLVRNYIRTINGFKKIYLRESQTNKGLANSIIDGVSEVIAIHGKVIVLEDDLITTSNFLQFMNQSLDIYENNFTVFSISGFSFDLASNDDYDKDGFFLNRGWSWGWATWKNRWELIDWVIKDYNKFISNNELRKRFRLLGTDVVKMLKDQQTGKVDSWAIRWFYNQFKVGGLTLYPLKSKVINNGFDQFATHTKGNQSRYIPNLDMTGISSFNFPNEIKVSDFFQKKFQKKMGILARVVSKIKTILKIKN